MLAEAAALLRGEGLPPGEADAQRDQLLAGFRWILVDEYQDIDRAQYELISAVAGRTLTDSSRKLTLFAVGDDDQNIYAYAGASVKYIRQFEKDYGAQPAYLTENYRSTGHIIAAANAWIHQAGERMKAGRPIVVDRKRRELPFGGDWERRDRVGRGRVQVITVPRDDRQQALAALAELKRLAALADDWGLADCRRHRPQVALPGAVAEPVRTRRHPVPSRARRPRVLLAPAGDPLAARPRRDGRRRLGRSG